MKAKHPAHANRHIAVAGKIKINLQRITKRAHPGSKHADLPRRQGKHRVRHPSHSVGDQQLFGQTANKTPDAERGLFRRCAALVDLFFNVVILDDRTGDQLRKKRNIEQNLHKGSGDGSPVTIHIDHIRKPLEGKKRNSDRQRNPRQREGQPQQAVTGPYQKVRVLEHRQHADPAGGREPHAQPRPFSRSEQAAAVIERNRQQQQRQISQLSERIENQA